jgi:hypothetical protein
MATYRVLNPKGGVVATEDINSADKAHAWFVDNKVDDNELSARCCATRRHCTSPPADECGGGGI